jgi:hypothetical protein
MPSITVTVTRDVTPDEFDDMIHGTGVMSLPWWVSATRTDDTWKLRYYEDGDSAGKIRSIHLSDAELCAAVTELLQRDYLDMSHDSTKEAVAESLGVLDSEGADMVLQWAVFGDLVFS